MKALVSAGPDFIGSHLVDRLLADGEMPSTSSTICRRAASQPRRCTVGGRHAQDPSLRRRRRSRLRRCSGCANPTSCSISPRVPRAAGEHDGVGPGVHDDDVAARRRPCARDHRRSSSRFRRPPCTETRRRRDLPLKEQPLEPRGMRGVIARATVDLLDDSSRDRCDRVHGARARPPCTGRANAPTVAWWRRSSRRPRRGRSPTITGDGRQTRDLVFVDDAVDALVRAGTRGSGLVVNVGTGEQTVGPRALEPRLRRWRFGADQGAGATRRAAAVRGVARARRASTSDGRRGRRSRTACVRRR